MAVVVKTSKLATLNKLGYQVGPLQAVGITMQVGVKVLKFYAHNGDLIATVELSVPYSQLLEENGTYPNSNPSDLLTISAALKALVNDVGKPLIKVQQGAPGTVAALMGKPGDLIKKADPDDDGPFPSEVIPLRQATKLHQRVQGTSAGSVYVVVGVGMSHVLNVAARIKDTGMKTTLSMRIEGILSQPLVTSFTQNHGFTAHMKDGSVVYLSGHYHCVPGTTPEKVLGSILIGCGVEFSTGMPNMNIVRKLGA